MMMMHLMIDTMGHEYHTEHIDKIGVYVLRILADGLYIGVRNIKKDIALLPDMMLICFLAIAPGYQ